MNELGDIENAIISVLGGVTTGGSALFATVEGFAGADRRALLDVLGRRRHPAALVLAPARLRPEGRPPVTGAPRFSVLLAASSLRGAADARVGPDGTGGAYEVVDLTTRALDGATLLTDRRLALVDEQLVAGDERFIVYEQRYAAERLAEPTAPTFDGVVLAGSGSFVQVVVGEVGRDTADFAFPGIDGLFRHELGFRGRDIRWRGQLQAVDDATLNGLEAGIESRIGGEPAQMIDAWGRAFDDCVVESYRRDGPRRRHPTTGAALQPFDVLFKQLNV